MTVVPLEFLPYRRELSIVLKISKRIMPVSGHRDLFAGKPTAVLQPALTDHRFQPGHPHIGAQSNVVLPRPYENHIPFLINQAIFHENSLAAEVLKPCLSYCKKILRYSCIFSAKAFWSISTMSTISILSASGTGG